MLTTLVFYSWRPRCCICEDKGFLETTVDYYWIPACFIPGTGFYSLRPWRFSPGGHGAVIVEAILFDFPLDAIVFLFLDTIVFYYWRLWCVYSWLPHSVIPGDRGVLMLETVMFYSWRPLRFIPDDHDFFPGDHCVLFLKTIFYSRRPWCFIPGN